MTVTSSYWMVNEMEGQKEIENFYKKLAEKLGFLPGQSGLEAIMSRITRTNAQLPEAMKRVQEESKKQRFRLRSVVYLKSLKKVTKSDENAADQNVLMETKAEVTKFEVLPIDPKEFAAPENYKLQKN